MFFFMLLLFYSPFSNLSFSARGPISSSTHSVCTFPHLTTLDLSITRFLLLILKLFFFFFPFWTSFWWPTLPLLGLRREKKCQDPFHNSLTTYYLHDLNYQGLPYNSLFPHQHAKSQAQLHQAGLKAQLFLRY